LRARQKRNLLATLFLSQGVPMLLAGDEMGHTQNGNNNAYCQDNELSWIDWDEKAQDTDLIEFTSLVIGLRNNHPVFRRRKFFQGRSIKGADVKDIIWLLPDGQEMSDEGWNKGSAQCLGLFLAGDGLDEVDEHAEPIKDESFLVLLNANHEAVPFRLPTMQQEGSWLALVDTSREKGTGEKEGKPGGEVYPLEARSMAILVARGAGQVRLSERRRGA
jgi:isoamylase